MKRQRKKKVRERGRKEEMKGRKKEGGMEGD